MIDSLNKSLLPHPDKITRHIQWIKQQQYNFTNGVQNQDFQYKDIGDQTEMVSKPNASNQELEFNNNNNYKPIFYSGTS